MDFLKINTPYINRDEMLRLLELASNNDSYTKRGGNSKCLVVENYAILKNPGIDILDFDKVIDDLYELKELGVNVTPILGYAIAEEGKTSYSGKRYDKGFVIQEKAKGVELINGHDIPRQIASNTPEKRACVLDYSKMMYNAPQEHFDKFIADAKMIDDKNIPLDFSKLTNFFYDNDIGFSFIDMNFYDKNKVFDELDMMGNNSHRSFIYRFFTLATRIPLQTYKGEPFYTPQESEFIKVAMCSIIEKCYNALLKVGISGQDIQNVFKEQSGPNGVDCKVSLYEFNNINQILDYAKQSIM